MALTKSQTEELLSRIKGFSIEKAGLTLFSWTSLTPDLRQYIDDEIKEPSTSMKSVLTGALRVSPAVTQSIKDRPTLIYKHHYAQLNYMLDKAGLEISEYVMSCGFTAYAVPASQIVSFTGQTGHFSHRHAALASGLGWIGYNNLLVTPQFGAHVRLVTILTDIDLSDIEPASVMKSRCDECGACIEQCPSKAIRERMVGIMKPACLCSIIQGMRGIGHHICGICIKPCTGFKEK
jgi:epoxyqueuosine reductase QueG